MIPWRAVLFATQLFVAPVLCAQEARHEHEEPDEHHHGLHFSHPLVTESPSPDTKIRVDALSTRLGDVTETGTRVEGEYAFTPAVSLAVTVPYVWLSTGIGEAHGVGNTELSLKAASLRWGQRGLLVGGGFSAGLPTGSDATGIGTSRAVELEPFADVAWKRGGLELVGFAHYSATVRNPAGADREREMAFDASVLHPVGRRLEALLELGMVRNAEGDVRTDAASIAPGLKLYPFATRAPMAGVSMPLGVSGEARDSRGVILSAFYHF